MDLRFKGGSEQFSWPQEYLSFMFKYFHCVWIFLYGFKNKTGNYWAKIPDMFPNCLTGTSQVEKSLKKFQSWGSLKIFIQLFIDFLKILAVSLFIQIKGLTRSFQILRSCRFKSETFAFVFQCRITRSLLSNLNWVDNNGGR